MAGAGNREAATFGRCGTRIGVSAAVVLRGRDCENCLAGLLDVRVCVNPCSEGCLHAGGWSVLQMSPANEDASVAQ